MKKPVTLTPHALIRAIKASAKDLAAQDDASAREYLRRIGRALRRRTMEDGHPLTPAERLSDIADLLRSYPAEQNRRHYQGATLRGLLAWAHGAAKGARRAPYAESMLSWIL